MFLMNFIQLLAVVLALNIYKVSAADHVSDFKTRIDDAKALITEANSFVPELQEGIVAGKNEVTSKLKEEAKKLESVTKELPTKMEQLPEEKKKEAMKGLKDALSQFRKALKQFIKKVQKHLTQSDNNSAPDDNDSCPAPNVMNSLLIEKTKKAETQIQELKTSAARSKRSASRKLKIKRALSLTIGLPVHITFVALCLVNIPFNVIGNRVPWWTVFPLVFQLVAVVIMEVSSFIETLMIPKEDMKTFNEALEIYSVFIADISYPV